MKVDQFLTTIRKYPKPFYRLVDFERMFSEERNTLQKSLERYVKNGLLTRLQKDVYVPTDRLDSADFLEIASQLYLPNYLSLESVLFRHGVINQPVFGGTFVTTRKTKLIKLKNQDFFFSQIKPDLWWGFKAENGMFVAELEKAIVDMLYLRARGKRHFSTDEWYLRPVDKAKLKKYLKRVGLEFGE